MKLPFVKTSASWFLVSTYLSWIFGVQADSDKQPIKRNSVGSGHVCHRRTSASYNHLDYCCIVFENMKQGAEVRKFCVCSDMSEIHPFEIVRVGLFLRSGVGAFS